MNQEFRSTETTQSPAGADHGLAKGLVTFAAADHVLGVIERHNRDRRDVRIDVSGRGCIWIRPDARCYSAEFDDAPGFFRARATEAFVTQHEPETARVWRPIEELLWQAGYFASQGRLLDRCSPFDVVQFGYWPNFTRLPHNLSALRLTALLVRSPMTFSLAYRSLHIAAHDAHQIYSAALASGVAQVVSNGVQADTDALHSKPSQAIRRVSGFWQKMLDRFAGL